MTLFQINRRNSTQAWQPIWYTCIHHNTSITSTIITTKTLCWN